MRDAPHYACAPVTAKVCTMFGMGFGSNGLAQSTWKIQEIHDFPAGQFWATLGQENWGQRSVSLGRGANPDPRLPLAACGLISLLASRPGTSGNF